MSWNTGVQEVEEKKYIVHMDYGELEIITGESALKDYLKECHEDETEVCFVYELGKEVRFDINKIVSIEVTLS